MAPIAKQNQTFKLQVLKRGGEKLIEYGTPGR